MRYEDSWFPILSAEASVNRVFAEAFSCADDSASGASDCTSAHAKALENVKQDGKTESAVRSSSRRRLDSFGSTAPLPEAVTVARRPRSHRRCGENAPLAHFAPTKASHRNHVPGCMCGASRSHPNSGSELRVADCFSQKRRCEAAFRKKNSWFS